MPVIRISDEVYRELQKFAVPLEDSPDDVLRRIFKISPRQASLTAATTRLATRTPEEAFRGPILKTLLRMKGKGKVKDVLDAVEQIVGASLTPFDHQPVKTGGVRWRTTAMFERKRLVAEGLLFDANSRRGMWELTPKGLQEAQKV